MRACTTTGFLLLCCFAMQTANAAVYPLPPPDQQLVGEPGVITARAEDTLLDIARANGVGYGDIVEANPGVDPWLPGEGTRVLLPTRYLLPQGAREGLILNLPEMRLFYYPPATGDEPPVVMTFPVSVGRMDWATPLGTTRVVDKAERPSWYPPASVRKEALADGRELPAVVPPGPDNPLGEHALRLGIPGYLIHGTNRPAGVGMRVTHGCVRMYPEDIAYLFDKVPVGTPVRIVNQPWKLGWGSVHLYFEAHRPLEEDQNNQARGLTALTELVVVATADRPADVDWDVLETVFRESLGVPLPAGSAPGEVLAAVDLAELDGWCAAGSLSRLCPAAAAGK